jgi:hypothetical protein
VCVSVNWIMIPDSLPTHIHSNPATFRQLRPSKVQGQQGVEGFTPNRQSSNLDLGVNVSSRNDSTSNMETIHQPKFRGSCSRLA